MGLKSNNMPIRLIVFRICGLVLWTFYGIGLSGCKLSKKITKNSSDPLAASESAAGNDASKSTLEAPNSTEQNPQSSVLPAVSSATTIATNADTTNQKYESFSQSFSTTQKIDTSLNLSARDGHITFDFVTVDQILEEYKTFQQNDRSMVSKIFRQGNPNFDRSESFTQSNQGVLDIQIVIDNSISMQQEQDRVKTRLSDLLSYIADSDWRINITTTDPGIDPTQRCSRGYIRKSDQNASELFAAAIDAGINGSPSERGILMATEGLRCAANNWVRAESSIAVLIVSDEDNCSDGNDPECAGMPFQNYHYLTDYLQTDLHRTLGKDARIYGIIWIPGTICDTGYNRANEYYAAVMATKGKAASICDQNYSDILQAISKDIASYLKNQFALKQIPDTGSIQISQTLNNIKSVVTDYTLKDNVITFNTPPPSGAEISINYKYSKDSSLTKVFMLGESPTLDTVKVTINGAVANPLTYSIDITTNSIIFVDPPPVDADIRVDFRRNTTLINNFYLNQKIVPSTLMVAITGNITKDFFMTPNFELVFANTPLDGATIEARYKITTGPNLIYNLPTNPDAIKDLSVVDIETGVNIPVVYNNQKLTLNDQNSKAGRKLRASYYNSSYGLIKIPLDKPISPSSLEVTATEGTCANQILTKEIIIDCTPKGDSKENPKEDPKEDPKDMLIHFTYTTEPNTTYSLPQVSNPDIGQWSVEINNKSISGFTRQVKDIILETIPGPNDTVTISYKSKI